MRKLDTPLRRAATTSWVQAGSGLGGTEEAALEPQSIPHFGSPSSSLSQRSQTLPAGASGCGCWGTEATGVVERWSSRCRVMAGREAVEKAHCMHE